MSPLAELFQRALAAHRAGQLDVAEQHYRQILTFEPAHADALHLLGMLAYQRGEPAAALELVGMAIAVNARVAPFHANLALAWLALEDFAEAAASCRRALAIDPDFAAAHHNLGLAFAGQRQLADAIACYRRAIELDPQDAKAYNSLANAYSDQGDLTNAAASYRRALELAPDLVDAHNGLGTVLVESGETDAAIACFHRALVLKPRYAAAHHCLGVALAKRGELDAALTSHQRALELQPDFVEAINGIGNVRREQGQRDEALASLEQALRLKPDYADAHLNRGLVYLTRGEFDRGWPEYEWRWQTRQLQAIRRDFAEPRWDGRPLPDRTILLHVEQGLGDTLQFVRYAALVKQRVGTVILECQAELVPLLATAPGVDAAVARGQPLPSFDLQLPLLSLPLVFQTRLETVPADVPYLSAAAELIGRWRREFSDEHDLRIGIAWQGSPLHANDRRRSFPATCFTRIANLPAVRVFSLQKGAGSEQLAAAGDKLPAVDLAERLTDFSETAAVMANLDLVISCDSAVAHLAGALGVPVWVALPYVADWRWLLERDDSPWYPTMRLFRQTQSGDWAGVFARIEAALSALVASRAP